MCICGSLIAIYPRIYLLFTFFTALIYTKYANVPSLAVCAKNVISRVRGTYCVRQIRIDCEMCCIEYICAESDVNDFVQHYYIRASYIPPPSYFGVISKLNEIHFTNCPEVLPYCRYVFISNSLNMATEPVSKRL